MALIEDVLLAAFRRLDPAERPGLRLVCRAWRGALGPTARWPCLRHWECHHPGVCAFELLLLACAGGRQPAAERLAPRATIDAGRLRELYRRTCATGNTPMTQWLAATFGLPAGVAAACLAGAVAGGHDSLAAWLRAVALGRGAAPPARFYSGPALALDAAAAVSGLGALDLLACRRASPRWREVGRAALESLARALTPERVRAADAATLGDLARRVFGGADLRDQRIARLSDAIAEKNRHQRSAAHRLLAGLPLPASRAAAGARNRLRAELAAVAQSAARWLADA